jgi:UDP-glucose:(heptosyl)LPS alpha-1,3-glucosyltransferase
LHRSLLFLEKRLFQSPQLRKIIANSQRGKEEIIRHYGIPAEKIEVIHNGVDLQTFHPRNIALYRKPFREELGIQAQAFVILFLGSGFRRKGLAPLLNAFCQVKKEIPGVLLIVVGKDRTEEYNKRARRMGAGREVLFLGPSKRAPELYAASDLFALPTFYDPFSNACLEAMATGIPVLTTLTNGVAELIEDQKNGFLIPDPTYVDEIAGKIKTFFYNRNRTSMGEKARESCSHLDMDSVLNRLIAIYEELKP